ncbi:MAG TPA: aminopeptidase P family N-terminal domain-containing protein, partial [Rhizomicrobium sp.]|nr:aminopeptidase P family N-terminal domain-containing protein [Rhizomicrobium sp.]
MDKTFQTFDDRSDAATVAPRLAALRGELAKRGLDGFIVPHSDEYQSEYLPECNERLAWLTSFTGSAGATVVLKDKAALFVDGRYTLQAKQQTDTKLFSQHDLISEGPNAWLEENAPKGARIGFDPWVHSAANVETLRASVEKAGAVLVPTDGNPIDAVWTDRPAAPTAKAMPHAMNVAGESAESKRTRIAEEVKKQGADAAIVSLADSICWLLNMRG